MPIRWRYKSLRPFDWSDKPVALIGGGASLKGHDLSSLAECYSVAVKGTIFDHPFVTIGFGLDSIDLKRWWWKISTVDFPVWWAVGRSWNDPYQSYVPPNLNIVRRNSHADGLSNDPMYVHAGGTSGFGALNVAYLAHAKRIVLFGYDYGSRAGEWHANGQHYNPRHFYNPVDWVKWAAQFDTTVSQLRMRGVEVVNASPDSIITAFPKVTVEEGLELCRI